MCDKTQEKKYQHGKCERKMKTFRLPKALVEKLMTTTNQTAVVVEALDVWFDTHTEDDSA